MAFNKDGYVKNASATERRWFLLAVGLFTVLCNVSQAKRTVCVPQPIRHDVTILGELEAGNFKKLSKKAKDMSDCLRKACNTQQGNIAYLSGQLCFSVACFKLDSCELQPIQNSGTKTAGALYRIIDAYPEFNSPRTVNVLENAPLLHQVLRFEVTAESRTEREEMMSYEIVRGNLAGTFLVYPKTSNWGSFIRLHKKLDRENITSYGVQIRATNLKENVSSLLNVTINVLDANDNPPQFLRSLFVFSVFSNMSVGSVIGRTVAKDNDTGAQTKLEYAIKQPSKLISYDKRTGEVRLEEKRTVDTVNQFDFDITATDGLFSTKGRLRIVLYPNNINRPVFEKTSYEVRLNGQVTLGTEVLRIVATDPDYGKLGELTYVILKGDEDDVFSIGKDGIIRTTYQIPLDREIYNLTIGVRDNGYPELYAITPANVVVLLQWIRFKQDISETKIPEDFKLLNTVFTASASLWVGGIQVMAGQRQRATQGINYYLDGGFRRFQMEETSGVITLHEKLDYETNKEYTLVLKAEYESADSTSIKTVLSARAILVVKIIDLNDNAPRFSKHLYTHDIWKSSSINSPILKINATDLDEGLNGLIHFEVLSGNFNETFSFEPDGMVFQKKSLLHNEHSIFNMTVVAWDSGEEPRRSPRSASVIISVKGHLPRAPAFARDSYNLLISENVNIGIPIYQVNASVVDNRWKITYWFRNLDVKMPFRVDPKTGWIYTTKKLDREEKPVYDLTYMAIADLDDQSSLITKVNVTIRLGDENDNIPTFPCSYYSTVVTSLGLGMSVMTVQAIDNDQGENGRIEYLIIKISDHQYFSIDSRSGEITTIRPLPTTSLLALKIFVSAKDHGNPERRSSLNPVPVFVIIGRVFAIQVETLRRTTTTITLRFTMLNVSLADISHIGVVVQAIESIADYGEVTKRDIVSWHYVHTAQNNAAYAQRYLTGNVTCTDEIRDKKSFDFTVGSDGDACTSNKEKFCNGKLESKKAYRFQLVAYFNNETSPENFTSIESNITLQHETGAKNARQTAGFRSWHYDIIVIVIGVFVGIIILATIARAIMLYRRDQFRMKSDEAKGGISYPLSNPRYRRSGTPRSSRSTMAMSFTELSKSRKLDKKMDKMSPCDTERLPMTEGEGISRDSGCGVSVKSSNSDIHHRGRTAVRKAFFSFGKNKKDEEQQDEVEEDGSDKEMETEINT
ncbi:cadherin-related tumor suppressor-like [Dendronephthya gigantea]|uniref:cadherin-related tumor suppressor-like n=1 Tax=Dendronephthya gigantea TaxID=151771 RepID=UPI00106D7ED4|nr:cadherin-related tumor suppressor-like [Dendronephthya gigantea]